MDQVFDDITNSFKRGLESVWKVTKGEFSEFVQGTAEEANKTWGETTKEMKSLTGKAMGGSVLAWFRDDMDSVEDIWDNAWQSMINKADTLWDGFLNKAVENAWSGLGDIFDRAVMEPSSNWLLSLVGLESGGGSGGFLEAISDGASFSEALEFAGLHDLSAWVESLGAGASSLLSGGGVPAAIAEGWGITAGVTDMGVVAGTEAATQAPSLAGMLSLASPLGAFGMALGPGLLGMGLSQMGFLMDGPMTPEEAISNWQGQENFLAGLSGNMNAADQDWAEVQDRQFGLFGQAAQKAADDLERLMTVAGYTQQQLDQVVESLDPLSQELVTSGQAANTLEAEVRQLAQEINAAAGSMSLTSQASKEFDGRIDDLAGRLGLSGDAALDFQSAIYQLAEGFSLGGEEATGFEAALDAFTQGALASLTEGAEGSREAIQGLIESMKGVAGASDGVKVKDMGGGVTQFTAIDYASGGAVDSLGLSSGGSGGIDDLGIGSFHRGGLVAGWPRAHAGALISSLAHDEVPIVARRGEYVVRAESVNAATLPALKALNQGGGMTAGDMAVNFTININGNVMGNDDQIEDMVRLIESRLRQLQSSRWGG
ncbi:MAG: hypothetical protein K9K66_09255 [Desulfarculaceae bacterium]|nr:hypothetical protein [Desulfarculaceae bacterium]MCF8101834.1 hypothetical protein [Desulfarculaceae bacterium]